MVIYLQVKLFSVFSVFSVVKNIAFIITVV